jgi:hypothetical protein
MKINIVWVDPGGDKIIDRLGRLLAERTGWTLSDRPSPGADLNYSLLYVDLAQRFSDWRKTPWVAYFSHYEVGTRYKEYWWDLATPLTIAQTITAKQYGDILPNPLKVTPPIDERFEIHETKPRKKMRIGISGFVAPGGRKGEIYLARLAGDFEGKVEFVASGVGWPVKQINSGLDGLPAFYNALDAYICTSTIEGIPMPPLEALACGVPVIIPQGVGMLDEIKQAPGVYRFEPGNYESMTEAVKLAKSENGTLDREALRELVADYSADNWVKSHEKQFAKLLSNGPKENGANRESAASDISVRMATDAHGRRGVYYVAYGEPARNCAVGAIQSFKQHLPEIPVALVSDKPLGVEDIFIYNDDEDIGGRIAKVKIYDLAPREWQYICYLDADTEIIAAETLLWRIVEDGWDMVICKNPDRFHIATQMVRSDNRDECERTFGEIGTDQLIQLNGGVFAFQRNERTRDFFHSWHNEWRVYGKRDQAALLRALFKHPLRMFVLGNEWNNVTRYPGTQPAWLNHYPMTARRWRGVVHHRLDDPGAWKAVKEFEVSRK